MILGIKDSKISFTILVFKKFLIVIPVVSKSKTFFGSVTFLFISELVIKIHNWTKKHRRKK